MSIHEVQSKAEPAEPVSISKEEINKLPLGQYEGDIRLIDSEAGARDAVRALTRERLLGFDTETRAAFRKGESYLPSLIQLAAEDAVFIFQLNRLDKLGGLEDVLSDHRIVKAGVSLAYDLKKLSEIAPFLPAGFVGLEQVSDAAGIRNNGLRALAAVVLGIRISKSAQCTNWSRPGLSRAQIVYAATDAWLCREIYLRLHQKSGKGSGLDSHGRVAAPLRTARAQTD